MITENQWHRSQDDPELWVDDEGGTWHKPGRGYPWSEAERMKLRHLKKGEKIDRKSKGIRNNDV